VRENADDDNDDDDKADSRNKKDCKRIVDLDR
jgi:hypothetical protein